MSEANIPDEIEKRHTALRGANVTTYYQKAYKELAMQFNSLAAERDSLRAELDRLRKELEQVKKERSEAEYDLQMTQVMAEANIATAGRERREAKEWADKCEASQRAWQENHAKALREVDFVRTKNEELEAWARELIEERNKLSTELDQLRKRAEEAERIIRNGEEQSAALKRLVPFCHHPANLVIGSAEGWICCECWAQQNEDALRKIAALPTDQTASPIQCEAVLIAMDALEASPSVRPNELQSKLAAAEAQVERLREVIRGVLDSATPHPIEHPNMFQAFAAARAAMSNPEKQ